MKRKSIILSAAVIGFILLGMWTFTWRQDTYAGKVSMTSEQYQVFKTEIAKLETVIQRVSVLDSKEPIVAEFQVRVPKNTVFPFGQFNFTETYVGPIMCSIFFLAITIIAYYIDNL